MPERPLAIEAGWKMQTETDVRDVRWGDPDEEGYTDTLRADAVLRCITAVHTTCEARLTTAEAIRIGEALQAGNRLMIQHGRMRLTGWFQLEYDDAGYLLTGKVEKIQYA